MLYKSNNEVYVFANNKYYKLEVEKNNLVPAKQAKYEIENKSEITYKDAMALLKKDRRSLKIQEEMD